MARSLNRTVQAASALALALGAAGAMAQTSAATTSTADAAPLAVCMAADNAPLSYLKDEQPKGLDVRIAQAAAALLKRPLKVVPFESEYEKESTLTHEVNALLSSGVCEAASGFPLLTGDLGAPTRPNSRTPDYPGAKRKRERPYITLGRLSPSRAYQAAVLGLVLAEGSATVNGLGDLGERRLGVVSGTLASSMAMTWRFGVLRPRLVSLNQREDVFAALEQKRFEAALVPLALFDGWHLAHPGTKLAAAAWQRPIGVNLGFVTLEHNGAVREALSQAISQALANGDLARWAAAEGVSFAAPVQPDVSRGPSLADLAGN